MTTLTIVPNIQRKTARATGLCAAGELVSVVIKGMAAQTAGESLRLRAISPNGKLLAVFPMQDDDAWTVSGEDACCTLNMGTNEAVKFFRRMMECDLLFVLDDVEAQTLYFAAEHTVCGWPRECGDDVTADLSNLKGKFAELSDPKASINSVKDVLTQVLAILKGEE